MLNAECRSGNSYIRTNTQLISIDFDSPHASTLDDVYFLFRFVFFLFRRFRVQGLLIFRRIPCGLEVSQKGVPRGRRGDGCLGGTATAAATTAAFCFLAAAAAAHVNAANVALGSFQGSL